MSRSVSPTSASPTPQADRASTSRALGGIVVMVVLLGAAFGLRVWGLHRADLTFDEVATVFVARRSLLDVVRYVMRAAREHPPFYYLLMSLWMHLAGTTEFAIRYPSVLIGVLTVSWGAKLGQRLLGRRGRFWMALLCAVAPFSVWAGRNGRMYALVLLLALMIMERWLRWRAQPDWQHWLAFTALSLTGAMTHYYLVLLWPVQALLLLLAPRKTRTIRVPWMATVGSASLGVAGFVLASPGVRAMVFEVAGRFPVRHFRWNDLSTLITDLYLWGFRPELRPIGLLALGLTALGWTLAWRRKPVAGALAAVWGLVPLIILHSVPEKLEARYLTPIYPALLLGLVALLAWLRPVFLHALAAGGLIWFCAWRLPVLYQNPDTTFTGRVQTLHAAARPGDGLLMNGPWPSLLLSYYEPPEDLTVHAVPAEAPPGFREAVDVPRLVGIVDSHDRLWVSYGAIRWADPEYSVSRWLAENTFCLFERYGMTLCVPPTEDLVLTRDGVHLGDRVRLTGYGIDRHEARPGDPLRVLLAFEGSDLDRSIGLDLALLDAAGRPWQREASNLGPTHQPTGNRLPERWREQRGLLIQPGIPPGNYTVALRVYGDDVTMAEAADVHGWISLGTLTIAPGTSDPDLVALLPNSARSLSPTAHPELRLVGFEPYSDRFMQGYTAGFDLWWQAQEPTPADRLQVRLVGPTTLDVGDFNLGPDHYPATVWQAGDVIRQSISFPLPEVLPAGRYRVEVLPLGPTGTAPEPDAGSGWTDLFELQVEARKHHTHAPLLRSRRAVDFGGILHLSGFRLEQRRPAPGDTVELSVYWKAQQQPNQIYAVFNHLCAPDGTTVWHGDSWPQAGIYTTDHWQAGEVVAETYTIRLPRDLAPGTYTLYTGVYDPGTGERLAATTSQGERLINDEFALLELEVR